MQNISISTNNICRQFQQQTILKKNNLNFEIICVVILISLLLNKLKESLMFIVIQIYNLIINNLNINTSRTSFIKKNNKLILSNIISIDTYNLDTKSKNSII